MRACVHVCIYLYYVLLCISLDIPHFAMDIRPTRSSWQEHADCLRSLELMVCGSLEKTAEHFKMAEEEVGRLLTGARETLFRERLLRPKPHRDNKILTAWNGERSGPRKVLRVYLMRWIQFCIFACHFQSAIYLPETGFNRLSLPNASPLRRTTRVYSLMNQIIYAL